jgi:UPF0755 protein
MPTPNPNIDPQYYHERNQEAKIVRRIVMITLLVITFTLIGGIVGGYSYIKSSLEAVDSKSNSIIYVDVPIGSSSTTIGKILEEKGLIKDARIFRFYVKFKNEAGFQAGNYQLSKSMAMQDIIDILKTGKVIQEVAYRITIPEGLTIPKLAKELAAKTDYEEDEVYSKLNDREYIQTLLKKYPILSPEILNTNILHPLEGYLHPLTYDFYVEEPTLEEIIEKMLLQTEKILASYKLKMEELGLSPHEVLTLASIVERESREKDDRYGVASVFHNRLTIGMALQSDITLMYFDENIGTIPTYNDTLKESPYNTYKYPGIPIGPIANPSLEAIDAVINPPATDNLFFYARPNGKVLYSENYKKHTKIKQKYQHEWHELNNNNE